MDINRHIDIMGIVNINDDSFFSGSRCTDVASAMKRVEAMVAEGATIIDFGACSTRPGSESIGADEEWRRLEPVLNEMKRQFPEVRLSVDTYWASVVQKVYQSFGDFIVNDISAGEDDPEMLPLVGRLGLTYVAMHKKGNPSDMQSHAVYENVTDDVVRYFMDFSLKASGFGIDDWILDPGFGFAKTIGQNYQLLRELEMLKSVSRGDGSKPRILVGVSRKSMVYRFLDITPEDSLAATQVVHLSALENGADILRVHDVAEAVRTVSLYRMLCV